MRQASEMNSELNFPKTRTLKISVLETRNHRNTKNIQTKRVSNPQAQYSSCSTTNVACCSTYLHHDFISMTLLIAIIVVTLQLRYDMSTPDLWSASRRFVIANTADQLRPGPGLMAPGTCSLLPPGIIAMYLRLLSHRSSTPRQ